MSEKPFSMPFLVEKYIKKTAHLTNEECGCYIRLLCHMWQAGGKLIDHDGDLARMLGASPHSWKKLRKRLEPFFEFHGGYIMQERLQKQWNFATEHSTKASEKASFAAKRRWEKAKGLKSINNVLQAMPQASSKQCLSDAILRKKDIPIPLSNSYAPEEGPNTDIGDKPGLPAPDLSRLLRTPLMRRSA